MFRFLVSITVFFIILCQFSCKRKVFDPTAYDELLYREPVVKPPIKEYIFNAHIKRGKTGSPTVETDWKTTGSALVSTNTITVTGSFNNDIVTIQLKNFLDNMVFAIGPKKDTASISINILSVVGQYVSKGRSHGQVTVIKLDKVNNQIEANFDMVLYKTSLDSIVITNGYFKINYSPNEIVWDDGMRVGGKSVILKAAIITGSKGNYYEIIGTDTLYKKIIKIQIPLDLGNSTPPCKLSLGTVGNLPAVYYTDIDSNFIQVKAFETGDIFVTSTSDNIISGSFRYVKVGGSPIDYSYGLSGSFSAKY